MGEGGRSSAAGQPHGDQGSPGQILENNPMHSSLAGRECAPAARRANQDVQGECLSIAVARSIGLAATMMGVAKSSTLRCAVPGSRWTMPGLVGPDQQPWSAIRASGLAPMASWAAVGCPCICFCASCDDVGLPPAARFMVSVGGCCLASAAIPVVVPVVCPVYPGVDPEPASLLLHGPAWAAVAQRPRVQAAMMFL